MTKILEKTRRDRLDRVSLLLEHYENGLAEKEVAEKLGLEIRTTNNYLHELAEEGKAYKEGRYWFAERWGQISLRKFDLEPEEAMVLYLAARLFIKQSCTSPILRRWPTRRATCRTSG